MYDDKLQQLQIRRIFTLMRYDTASDLIPFALWDFMRTARRGRVRYDTVSGCSPFWLQCIYFLSDVV